MVMAATRKVVMWQSDATVAQTVPGFGGGTRPCDVTEVGERDVQQLLVAGDAQALLKWTSARVRVAGAR